MTLFESFRNEPLRLGKILWPHVQFYREQREVIESVRDNDETFVPAANMMGKDFVSAFIVLHFFLTRHPCRVITTSAKDEHLAVLWGEIGRFIQTSKVSLIAGKGGCLQFHHQFLRKVRDNGEVCRLSYVKGMVASQDRMAAMQGHHIAYVGDGIPRTLFVSDEASSVPDDYWTMVKTWMNRALVIGNTWPCENFFKHAVKGKPGTNDKGGDIKSLDGKRFYRKVIRIRADQSPNVRKGLILRERFPDLDRSEVYKESFALPGVLPFEEYEKRRAMLNPHDACVSLDADFYEGAEIKFFPREWLDRANEIAKILSRTIGARRNAKAIGIDPAEGGDKTAMAAVDEYGLIELVSKPTPDTSRITAEAIAFMRRWCVEPEYVCFDRGGGGKEHADRLRSQGYNVRTISFGEVITQEPKRSMVFFREKVDVREHKQAYVNRRAEMFGELRMLIDPGMTPKGFGIPMEYEELRRQLSPIPLDYDQEGRIKLPPKRKPAPNSEVITLMDLIGCSPDEADALAIAVWSMNNKPHRARAGVMVV
jgi:hypothetical protein